MKKKLFTRLMGTVLTAAMVMGLAGCGSSTATAGTESGDSTDAAETTEAADSGEKVDLSFYIWNDEENYISKVVDEYNASQVFVLI